MSLLATIAIVAVHALALAGWGRALARACALEQPSLPLSAAGGLGVVVGLGGLLNLAGQVSSIALWLIVVLGLVFYGLSLRGRARSIVLVPPGGSSIAAGLITLVVMLVVCAALVPALQFNYHDDFQKYFAHPVRMLATGSVHGSTLSAIGVETLGGQAFLHSFVLNLAEPAALNAVELGLALPLCLLLAGLGPAPARAVRAARLAGVLALLVVNPQIVNVSASFTGAALALAILLSALALPAAEAPSRYAGHAVFIGCLLGAMCALKTSFVPLALVLALAHALALRSLRWAGVCALSSAAWLLPWLLAYLPLLGSIGRTPAIAVPAGGGEKPVSPFELGETGFGDGVAPYTLAVLVCVAIALFGFLTAPRAPRRSGLAVLALASSLGLAGLYLLLLYVVAPRAEGSATSLRLFVPMLLGVLPATLILACAVAQPRRGSSWIVPFGCALAVLASFASGVPRRLGQALELGSVLAFEGLPRRPGTSNTTRRCCTATCDRA